MSLIELSFESHKEKERFAMVDFFYEQAIIDPGQEDPALLRMMLFYALLRLNHLTDASGVEELITKYKEKALRV